MKVQADDWCYNYFWAPEVIRNPADGKYYLYFSAAYRQGLKGEGLSTLDITYMDRLCLGVAVSDTPVGPFTVVNDIDETTGNKVPVFNFRKGCGTEYDWSAIDAHPFFDDDGTLYMYFSRSGSSYAPYSDLIGIWGMKMKSMTEPDYSTVVCLCISGAKTVSSVPGKIESVERGEKYNYDGNSRVNEGPIMVKRDGVYYLTYSSRGYEDPEYAVYQAISDQPLAGFEKLDEGLGNPVLKGVLFQYMNGTGHHAIVRNGEELWIIYHRHNSLYTVHDRLICADRLAFVENSEGQTVLTANGPSLAPQWLPDGTGEYSNIATDAKISISTGSGAAYLNDELLPYYDVAQNRKVSFNKDITITLRWDKPVDVTALMIFNSNEADRAFSKIADIRFKTTQKQDGKTVYKVIKDLLYPSELYYDDYREVYQVCTPAIAEFDVITVTELQITIRAGDAMLDGSSGLDVSEIVVLGGKTNG